MNHDIRRLGGADPREILDVRWCSAHTPESGGLHDAVVRAEAYLSGSAEAGGVQGAAHPGEAA